MNQNYTKYSNFWTGRDSWYSTENDTIDELLGLDKEVKKGRDLIALSGYKRAIGNFVNIVTSKYIPVKFKTGESYTDGKTVTIGANLNDKNFDVAVGLALHEGSHIKLSSFDFIKDLDSHITPDIFDAAEKKGIDRWDATSSIKSILNYVEDRRIDHYIYATSPGYRGYYNSMYSKYFNNKVIDKALKSSEYRNEDWDSYQFRLINLHNKNRDLRALNGLIEIWKAVNLKSISRLKTTEHAFSVAIEVYKIILSNIKVVETGSDKEDGEGDNESTESGSGDSGSEGTVIDTGNAEMTSDNNASGTEELSNWQKEQLSKAIQKQKDFIDNKVKKTNLSKKDASTIDTLDSSGATYEDVAVEDRWGGAAKVKTLVIRELTQALVDSGQFSMASEWNGSSYANEYNGYNYVEEGLRLGTQLGRKLKVRGEETLLKYSRKNSGKIDRRIIAELGFDNANIFSQTFVERYNKAHLHLSIDASGSMNGKPWNKAMTSAVAMIKAAQMAGNIDVVVTIRSTHSGQSARSRSSCVPVIMTVYDSRKDKLNKVKSLFKYLKPSGTTPEGLTFAAIQKELIPGDKNIDSYFINFSDGMPMFSADEVYYSGTTAINHTRKSIDNIRKNGIRVLSYFISDSDYGRDRANSDFKKMYGPDSRFINPTNMMDVARTMNAAFLDRG
jgi:hypothetical protein